MTTAAVEELAGRLDRFGVDISSDPDRRLAASRDFSWLSPILSAKLPERVADVVAFPAQLSQLQSCVESAALLEVPITIRGRGTGNYGQSVPLEGGLVIDTTRFVEILEIGDGFAHVDPGISCIGLERAVRETGQELSLFPSTTTSTIGGFVSGGAGGSGSIEHGFIWDGFVLGATILSATAESSPQTFAAGDLARAPGVPVLSNFLHTYGTVGVIAELTVRLDPLTEWTGFAMSFPTMENAHLAARSMLDAGLRFRLLGVSEAGLVADFPRTPWLDLESASLRAVIDPRHLDVALGIGERECASAQATGEDLIGPITQLSYNHVTLRAKRANSAMCHVQCGGIDPSRDAVMIKNELPGARLHQDAMRGPNGVGFGGLVISEFTDETHLRDAMAALRESGFYVVDPHTWAVGDEDGAHGKASVATDPRALLNPGKLSRPKPTLDRSGASS